MRAVDTNVLIRLIARDDPVQTKAASNFIENGAWVSSVAFAEAIWVLHSVYKRSAGEIAGIVQRLLENEKISLQDADVIAAALDTHQKRPSVGFTDCMILETARKAGQLPLGTFDRNLAKVDGAVRP